MNTENTIPLRLIQNGEFEILKYIRDLCDQNGLMYYLAYGTLLGAVRHQGFIPWDDDMDVHMPREDFLKLIEIIQEKPHPYYKLISGETTPAYTREMAKMIDSRTKLNENLPLYNGKVQLGIFVDIFLLDGAGNSQEEAENTYRQAFSVYRDWRRAIKKMFIPGQNRLKTFLLWVKHVPERTKGVHYWMKKHQAICVQKAYADCTYIGALGAGTPEPARNIWKKECFGKGTDVVFKREVFRAPADWDTVLRSEYGDYMQLPPPEKQHPHHRSSIIIPDPAVLEEFSR